LASALIVANLGHGSTVWYGMDVIKRTSGIKLHLSLSSQWNMPNLLMAEMQDGNGHHIEFKKNIFG